VCAREDLRKPEINAHIARAMADWHRLDAALLEKSLDSGELRVPVLWRRMRSWFAGGM
jgi:hypothetical protein